MDYDFGVIDKVIMFDVDIGQVFPIGARNAMYIIILSYFSISLASRYFGIFFSGRIYDFEQSVRPLIENARRDFDADEEYQAQADGVGDENDEDVDRFDAYMQGMTDRIAAESKSDRVRYTIALAFRTTFEIYLPLTLGIAMLIWTMIRM